MSWWKKVLDRHHRNISFDRNGMCVREHRREVYWDDDFLSGPTQKGQSKSEECYWTHRDGKFLSTQKGYLSTSVEC